MNALSITRPHNVRQPTDMEKAALIGTLTKKNVASRSELTALGIVDPAATARAINRDSQALVGTVTLSEPNPVFFLIDGPTHPVTQHVARVVFRRG